MAIKSIKSQDQGQTLANFLRRDKLHIAKDVKTSKIRQLLEGLAIQIGIAEGILDDVQKNYDIKQTVDFLTEWEGALGIPDDVFMTRGSIADRRKNILLKLASLGISTKQQFENLALIIGLTVEVFPGSNELVFPLKFPITFNKISAKWVMIIKITADQTAGVFPYTFPFILGSGEKLRIIQRLFQLLAPSNIYVIFKIV